MIAHKLRIIMKRKGLYQPFTVGREVWALVNVDIPSNEVWTVFTPRLEIYELGGSHTFTRLPQEIMVKVGNPEVIVFMGIKEKFEAWKKEKGWR